MMGSSSAVAADGSTDPDARALAPLRVVILAGGKQEGRSMLLSRLGDDTVLELGARAAERRSITLL